jgi:hypothetical protein
MRLPRYAREVIGETLPRLPMVGLFFSEPGECNHAFRTAYMVFTRFSIALPNVCNLLFLWWAVLGSNQ